MKSKRPVNYEARAKVQVKGDASRPGSAVVLNAHMERG
jgi:hypothetical protein